MVYSRCNYIFIFGAIIFLNDVPATLALSIIRDQYTIEKALHTFMVKRKDKLISKENISSLPKRLKGSFSICGLSAPRKLNLCKRALVEEDKFVEEFKTADCKPRKFQYTFTFDEEEVKKEPSIHMYQCPNLLRRNPKTGDMIPDDRVLLISRMSSGIEQAMVFKRDHEGARISAARHLIDITKYDLDFPPDPPPTNVIRSIDRFPPTPSRSAGNSPSHSPSPGIRSPQFMTPLNSPSHLASVSPGRVSPTALSPSRVSPTALSPSRFSPTALSPSRVSPTALSPSRVSPTALSPSQSPNRNLLSGITSSSFFGPLARSPQNVGTKSSHRSKKSTPSGSPLYPRSPQGSNPDSPFLTPDQSPRHSSASVATPTRRRGPPPPGIFLRDPTESRRLSSASVSGESSDESSRFANPSKQKALSSSRFAGVTSTGVGAGAGRRISAADVSQRLSEIQTDTLESPRTFAKAPAPGGSNQPATSGKKMHRHRSFNRDRATRSENNSPPDEEFEFPGLSTPPIPEKPSLDSLLGKPASGSTIHRTQSENILDPHSAVGVSYPIWPRSESKSNESSAEIFRNPRKNSKSANVPPVKILDPVAPRDIISEWQLHRQKMKNLAGGKHTAETSATDEDNAAEDISEVLISPLSRANLISAYQKNVERRHTRKPTVLKDSRSDDSKTSLKLLFQQEPSEESGINLADTSASASLPATKDVSVQVDLPETNNSSSQTDDSGDADVPVEDVKLGKDISGSQLTAAVRVIPPSITNESDQAIPVVKKDQSGQFNPPAKSKASIGIQTDSLKLVTTTGVSSTAADTTQQTGMYPESSNLELQTLRDTADQVDEAGGGSNIYLPRASADILTDIPGKARDILPQAQSEIDTSTNVPGRLETDEAVVVKSADLQTRSGSELRNRSRSITPPRRSSTTQVDEPEKDTTVLPQTSPGRGRTSVSPGRFHGMSRRTIRSKLSTESKDETTEIQENLSTLSIKDESSSTGQKNDDEPSSKNTDITPPEGSLPLSSGQPGSAQSPTDESKKKQE